MTKNKVIAPLRKKRFVFGMLKAKYWAESNDDQKDFRGGFRTIHIYEAELHCKKSVLGADSIYPGALDNQDKLYKKFNAVVLPGELKNKRAGQPVPDHAPDLNLRLASPEIVSDAEQPQDQHVQDYLRYYTREIETNFVTSFPPHIKTFIHDDSETEQYALSFESAKLYNFRLSDVQDEGAESSGTIEGTFIGYIAEPMAQATLPDDTTIAPEPKSVVSYPYFTGVNERKAVGADRFARYQVCEAPYTYTWSDWFRTSRVVQPAIYTGGEWFLRLIGLLIFIALALVAWRLLLGFVVLIGIGRLFSSGRSMRGFRFAGRALRGLFTAVRIVLLLGGLIAFIGNSGLFGRRHAVAENTTQENQPQQQVVGEDTIIANYRAWTDYHGSKYEGLLRVNKRDYRAARYFRNGYSGGNEFVYGRMYRSLAEQDDSRMQLVYQFFDSLRTEHRLDHDRFAETIITCIQDIPYYLITSGPCDYSAYPESDFEHNYLLGGGLCEGYEANGILSPAEFVATMKGDCDTRTVFAYTILRHFGYSSCVYTSEHYGHSILGVELENKPTYDAITQTIDEVTYTLCELTVYGPRPGQLPDEISNLKYWNIELN